MTRLNDNKGITVATVNHLELALLSRAQSMTNAYRFEFEAQVKALAKSYRHAFQKTNCNTQRSKLIMSFREECDALIRQKIMQFEAAT